MTKKEWGEKFQDLYDKNALTPVWNKVYKTAIVKKNVRFNPRYFIMEDLLFVLDYLQYCDSIYCMPNVVYRYRQPEDELHGYARMKRVSDLNDFMLPFEDALQRLKERNPFLQKTSILLGSMYYMILEQKLFKASWKDIVNIGSGYKNCKYYFYVGSSTSRRLHNLHNLLINSKTGRIAFLYSYKRKRHYIASFIKKWIKR